MGNCCFFPLKISLFFPATQTPLRPKTIHSVSKSYLRSNQYKMILISNYNLTLYDYYTKLFIWLVAFKRLVLTFIEDVCMVFMLDIIQITNIFKIHLQYISRIMVANSKYILFISDFFLGKVWTNLNSISINKRTDSIDEGTPFLEISITLYTRKLCTILQNLKILAQSVQHFRSSCTKKISDKLLIYQHTFY